MSIVTLIGIAVSLRGFAATTPAVADATAAFRVVTRTSKDALVGNRQMSARERE